MQSAGRQYLGPLGGCAGVVAGVHPRTPLQEQNPDLSFCDREASRVCVCRRMARMTPGAATRNPTLAMLCLLSRDLDLLKTPRRQTRRSPICAHHSTTDLCVCVCVRCDVMTSLILAPLTGDDEHVSAVTLTTASSAYFCASDYTIPGNL
ncbi:hypothetical protein WA026_003127 [Henosepilachna vigintioctopunctata]|uniref:Uncharacterized protein n=1 Tax=Henosepilachna vigintioctopunctata TaxID=420089 RepID=A0AAW1TLE1_9CUCU